MADGTQSLPGSCSLDTAPGLGLNTSVVCVWGGCYKVTGKGCFGRDVGSLTKGRREGRILVEEEILAELPPSSHPSSSKLKAVGCGVLRHRLSGRGLRPQDSLFWRKNQEPGDGSSERGLH